MKRLAGILAAKQEDNNGECLYLCQILFCHLARIREVYLIDHKKSGSEQQALPYLLVLEVGIVLAQPTAVLYQCMDVIQDKEDHDSQLPVCRQVETIELVVPDNAHGSGYEDWHLRQDPRPEGTLAVLQHVQQEGHHEWNKGDMVERNRHDVTYQTVVRQPIDAQHIPPYVAQCRHDEEGSRPSA